MQFDDIRQCRVLPKEVRIQIGERGYDLDDSLTLDAPFGEISIRALNDVLQLYLNLSDNECQPQAAILVFQLIGQIQALAHYFPILRILDEKQQIEFHALMQRVLNNKKFRVLMKDPTGQRSKQAVPEGVKILIAGHICEIFFFQQEMLARFLKQRRSFWVYPTKSNFATAGGRGGGDYHLTLKCIRLYMQRIFEGFYGSMPAQAPFIHEFGHMLEHFESWRGISRKGTGLLPGMLKRDGKLYNPEAHHLFVEGKQLEMDRYQKFQTGQAAKTDPQPLGNPYVFKNNSEFIAGYLEMFFRNPNQFAKQNTTLYRAFERLIGWDPRQAWKQDYDAYIKKNQQVYASGTSINKSGLI
jgi:Mlc titration factor MtfA (ptsG expression regulator)